MAEVVNLKRFKKQVARTEQAKLAEANRAKFGRTRAERNAETARSRRAESLLDQHRIEDGVAS